MRFPTWKLAALSVALVLVFALPAVGAARLQPSFERDGRPDYSSHAYPFLRWLRDSVVEVIFGKPSTRAKSSRPDAVLQSLYRNDVVIRFNVTASEEESALATAAQQMFLDVWAFTPEYVDVRINKDDVASLLSLLPSSLQPSVLIPDVAAAVWRTYPSTAVGKSQFESSMADPAKTRTSLDGVGNVFFSNYQTLPVSCPCLAINPRQTNLPRSLRAGCASSRLCSLQSRK